MEEERGTAAAERGGVVMRGCVGGRSGCSAVSVPLWTLHLSLTHSLQPSAHSLHVSMSACRHVSMMHRTCHGHLITDEETRRAPAYDPKPITSACLITLLVRML